MAHILCAAIKIKRDQVHSCSSEMQMFLWSSYLLATEKKPTEAFSALETGFGGSSRVGSVVWGRRKRLVKFGVKVECSSGDWKGTVAF